jgi:cell fate regulator YaaT (PSP1 superfamily)
MMDANRNHIVRVSTLGQIGRFVSADPITFPRGSRVICRTRRGLEVGEVMSHTRSDRNPRGESDGTVLRAVTPQDELLLLRLRKNRHEALEKCQRWLTERQVSVTLVDVEQLFDGKSIYFYFLGEVSEEVNQIVERLAATYEAEVRIGDFARAVEDGCGPNCGTDEAEGCGDSCSTCAVANACVKS